MIKRKNIGKLCSEISKDIAILRKTYKKSCKDEDGSFLWLTDNYHIYFSAFKEVFSAFSPRKKLPSDGKYPRICCLCSDFLNSDFNEERLLSYFESINNLQYDEIALIIPLLKYCCIKRAAAAAKNRKNYFEGADILRKLDGISGDRLIEKISACPDILRRYSCYEKLDSASKRLYLEKINTNAIKSGISEEEYLEKLIDKADGKDLSFLLFKRRENRFFFALSILFLFIYIPAAVFFKNLFIAMFLIVPIYVLSRTLIEKIYGKITKPEKFPSVKENKSKTLVCTVSFASSAEEIKMLLQKTEKCFYSNFSENFRYGLLLDLKPSETEFTAEDETLCSFAESETEKLNKKLGDAFFIAIRKKKFNKETKKYAGEERKRGAVSDFISAIYANDFSEFSLISGDIFGAEYITLLDSDTVPSPDSVARLIGVLEHPVTAPVIDCTGSVVESGYGIAVPSLGVLLSDANKTRFTAIKSENAGSEPYSDSVFSIGNDLFGEGIFCGKGVVRIKEFYELVAKAFPKGKILSHDIPEGNILRTAYISDAVFYDDIPDDIVSFTERGCRWIRGDIQNTLFLKKSYVNGKRQRVANEMGLWGKYLIFNNAVSAFYFPSIFFLVLSSIFFGILPVITAVLLFFFEDIRTLFESLFRKVEIIKIRKRNRFSSGTALRFSDRLLSFICLPYIAVKNLAAIIRAIYAMKTGKGLLEWKTAASLGGKGRKLKNYFLKMYPQYIGVLLLFFSQTVFVGILWLFSFFVAALSAKPAFYKKKTSKNPERKNDIFAMWKYFSDFVNEENNFLPPDNFQEEPVCRLARRTSPTNIGLYLVSVFCVYYLGIIDLDELSERVENTVSSIVRLKKYKGHLYNWYSTEDLSVLSPEFISTVDNGNFACALVTAKNAAEKLGICDNAVKNIEKILKETDFGLLYDRTKKLLSIGYDPNGEKLSDSYYDIYASESLLAYYYAISERQIDYSSFEKLNRFRCTRRGSSFIKSWSGTMFEYFMPCLFLPIINRSFEDEMIRGAFAEQLKRNSRGLWGNSESSYFAFDEALNYKYRAFGVKTLSLERGTGRNNVVSPYSSWLTLPFFSEKSNENLDLFKEKGVFGKYGFYDAADLTESRTGKPMATVKNYMAHHIGMSIIAGTNYLADNIIVKDFFDCKREAYQPLLEEKTPDFSRNFSSYPDYKKPKNKLGKIGEAFENISVENPRVKVLSDGNSALVLSDSGNGYFSVGKKLVTKRKIRLRENFGLFAFFITEKEKYSPTLSPFNKKNNCTAMFGDGKITYSSKNNNIETSLAVTLSGCGSCAIFEFTVKNTGKRQQSGNLVFYTEPILSGFTEYSAHPAFSELFLEGKHDADENNIFISRKRRVDGEVNDCLLINVFDGNGNEKSKSTVSFSRYDVIGTGREIPDISDDFSENEKSDGAFCVAIKLPAEIKQGEERRILLTAAYGKTKEETEKITGEAVNKTFSAHSLVIKNLMAGFYSETSLKKPEIRIADIIRSAVFVKHLPDFSNIGRPKTIKEDFFWSKGISLDIPLVVFSVKEENKEKILPFLRAVIFELRLAADFNAVICYNDGGDYKKPVFKYLTETAEIFGGEKFIGKNLFFISAEMPEIQAFSSIAALFIDIGKPSDIGIVENLPLVVTPKDVTPVKLPAEYKCGDGYYVKRNGMTAFAIEKTQTKKNRALWCGIAATDSFGTVITEKSLGFSFAENSGLNKLTAWSNDPVSGSDGEMLFAYINGTKYDIIKNSTVIFGKGIITFLSEIGDIRLTVEVFVSETENMKTVTVGYENPSEKEILFEYEIIPILDEREKFTSPVLYKTSNVLLFKNSLNMNFSGCGFLGCINGKVKNFAVRSRANKTNFGEEIFILGFEKDKNAAIRKALLYSSEKKNKDRAFVVEKYSQENGITLRTPDKKLNYLFEFLKYQTEVSRIKARAGYYQCGGAVGFRDRLQDAVCLAAFEPELLKKSIIEAASRQFEEGDVLHWWHDCENGKIKGSRTRSSDDLLWLPYSVSRYFSVTENTDFLYIETPYISGEKLGDGESEKYIEARKKDEKDIVYNHAKKAILKAATVGKHGLVLFGSGDWNDGMTEVGKKGKGESVWTTLFIIRVMKDFAEVSEAVGDDDFLRFLSEKIREYTDAVEKNCWDGDWYIRGFFDDGTPLGSKDCDECKIDILPQAFSVISGGFSASRTEKAMVAARKHLVDDEMKIVKLFSPPFDKTEKNPGYIKGYIPGVRENGGQYTHAAVWYAYALLERNAADEAFEIISYLNPLSHSETENDVSVYKKEPYVMAGDVYDDGTGGWSFYTGSAGWYFRTVTEKLLGITVKGETMYLSPCLPSSWDGYFATVRLGGTVIDISVEVSVSRPLTVDGIPADGVKIDGGYHRVRCCIDKGRFKS